MTAKGRLIAVDGIYGGAIMTAAKALLAAEPRKRRGGVSEWDASGVFGDLMVADADAGRASARTLVLLYAADLAFRLRWEIRPALAEGRVVAAAPYVETAVAFGRAAGLPAGWLRDVLSFAPQPDVSRLVESRSKRKRPEGFIEFAATQVNGRFGLTRRETADRARRFLKRAVTRGPRR